MNQLIIPFENCDKKFSEKWYSGRGLSNFPHPFRMLLIGGPNVGKTTLAKNIVIQQKPRFDQVYVIHEDPDSREWEDLDATDILSELPELNFWQDAKGADEDKPLKNLVIIDDMELTSATKERNKRLALLFRYVSSHCHLSVIFCHQSWFDCPPIIKKTSNIYVIWKTRGRDELELINTRLGLPKGTLFELFRKIATAPRDSICADFTLNSPCKFRLNIFQPILEDF